MRQQGSQNTNIALFRSKLGHLMNQVSEVMRYYHCSKRSEDAYVQWIKKFIFFHKKRHPSEMGKAEIEVFLSDLAVEKNLVAATQSQVLNAIVFLYRKVLDLPVADDLEPVRSKKPLKLPVVLSQKEVRLLVSEVGCV